MSLRDLFDASELPSTKIDSYFDVYERLLGRCVGMGVTVVEVGVGGGGSLLTWQRYFKNARVIGVDINPDARAVARPGIEIVIGDQASDEFWTSFYQTIGPVDVVIDDGGHTNEQQVVTAVHALRNLRNGGLLLVEDVHTSYLAGFANPSRYSFINFAKHLIDDVNSRCPDVAPQGRYRHVISSIEFHESIVAIHVNRDLPESALVENRSAAAQSPMLFDPPTLSRRLRPLRMIPLVGPLTSGLLGRLRAWRANHRIKSHFH